MDGEYVNLIPIKDGFLPAASLIMNVSVGSVLSGPLGSLSSLSVSLQVLVIVVTSVELSTPLTVCGPETCKERLGTAVTVAEKARPARAMRNPVESIANCGDQVNNTVS